MEFPARNEGSGGIDTKLLVKLKDNESVIGLFAGNPYDFRQHWVNKSPSICKGDGCPLCAKGEKSKFRFRLNFITKVSPSEYAVKVFEQGWTTYETLSGMHQSGYALNKTVVKITRKGSGQNTSYLILPVPNFQLTPAMEKHFATLPLNDLKGMENQATSGSQDQFAPQPSKNDNWGGGEPMPQMQPAFDESDVPF